MFGSELGKARMSFSRIGSAASKALASRQSWTKSRWFDVKVEEVGSSRRMAVLSGSTARSGYRILAYQYLSSEIFVHTLSDAIADVATISITLLHSFPA